MEDEVLPPVNRLNPVRRKETRLHPAGALQTTRGLGMVEACFFKIIAIITTTGAG
jgi:hypothetical protein